MNVGGTLHSWSPSLSVRETYELVGRMDRWVTVDTNQGLCSCFESFTGNWVWSSGKDVRNETTPYWETPYRICSWRQSVDRINYRWRPVSLCVTRRPDIVDTVRPETLKAGRRFVPLVWRGSSILRSPFSPQSTPFVVPTLYTLSPSPPYLTSLLFLLLRIF